MARSLLTTALLVSSLLTACAASQSAADRDAAKADHDKLVQLETQLGAMRAQLAELRTIAEATATGTVEQKLDILAKDLAETKALLAAKPPGMPARPTPRPTADPLLTFAVPVDGLPARGRADARVTIVEGYEYACPFCNKVRPTLDELARKYGKDLRIVSKAFVVHPQVATASALAACAAHKQGQFAVMDGLLWSAFESRNFDKAETDASGTKVECWSSTAGCPIVEGFARQAKLDVGRFRADMRGDCQDSIKRQQQELVQVGQSATPGFFINGRFLSGAQPIESFTKLIDEELAKAQARIVAGTKPRDYYQTWVIGKGEKSALPPPASP